ncbi:Peptidyl-prolyl cis-trans isomerase FKBP12 [Abeliophyllum distichum]|uniref:peptidylprolyl isomerase n=1 Tax=Abeliophyllum distichum TaxID=126358 RepID=A0ABD1NUE7_9LAMI
MGVEKKVLTARTGPKPVPDRTSPSTAPVLVKMVTCPKNSRRTKDPGQKPFSFQIGQGKVIKGWDEGVLGMQVGEVARLRCTPDYGYGPSGFPAWGIQPNSVLIFEIEVLSLK